MGQPSYLCSVWFARAPVFGFFFFFSVNLVLNILYGAVPIAGLHQVLVATTNRNNKHTCAVRVGVCGEREFRIL